MEVHPPKSSLRESLRHEAVDQEDRSGDRSIVWHGRATAIALADTSTRPVLNLNALVPVTLMQYTRT